ncbi:hypothetical protein BOTBODRAFT_149288 [Botryobasidium botryosum FD-172 SS1]|uniref:Zn(2)-C6 fungal-type domain-containing protein n=1 Tax=Botryobasidium botryosum (strain FD-172 SS1) TaxID=930990 RepID=A0A067M5V6_BOTB1|nr:hypothetical protein BOTBODRAFT_149288 [Botryobasidium botryosum FD-172 SS1]
MLERGQACTLCRRRKQRCDAVKPVCGPCTRSRGPINCVYTTDRQEVLERRIIELESNIALELAHQAGLSNANYMILPPGVSLSPSAPTAPPPNAVAAGYRFNNHVLLPEFASQPDHSLSPCTFPTLPLGNPDLMAREEVPHFVKSHLIDLFIRFRWRHSLEFNTRRLLDSLNASPSATNAVHPALVDAMMLSGCLYAEEGPRRYERLLVSRLRKGLEQSVAHADRLFDCIRALALFGCYLEGRSRCAIFFLFKGSAWFNPGTDYRSLEARYYISGSMALSIACGLHTIQSLDLHASASTSLLNPAADLVELGDRINTFWTLFGLDRLASLRDGGAGCRPTDDQISTVWPCPSERYENAHALSQEYSTVKSLYSSLGHVAWDINEHPISLRAKGLALLGRASALVARSNAPSSTHTTPPRLEVAASNEFRDEFTQQDGSSDLEGVRATLVTAITAAHGALIQIYEVPIDVDHSSALERQWNACQRVMAVLTEVGQLPLQYIPLALSSTLKPAYDFLAREVNLQVHEQRALDIQMKIDVLSRIIDHVERGPVPFVPVRADT